MGIIPDELKRQTFPCPQCKQVISNEVDKCRFCGMEIDEILRESSVRDELLNKSRERLKNHKFYIAAGIVVFCCGLGTLIFPILESAVGSRMINFSCWTPLLILGGLGAAIMGLRGYLNEKNYLRDV